MNKPDIIYKYIGYSNVHSDCNIRCDFLNDGLFRFTQVSELNDPFEARPGILLDQYSSYDIEVARMMAKFEGMDGLPDEEIQNLFLNAFPAERMDEKNFPGLWPIVIPELRLEPFNTIKEVDEFRVNIILNDIYSQIDASYGLFCLSELKDNVLLWSHYAESHQGIVVGFDKNSPFFNDTGLLRSVTYSNDRVSISANDGIIRVCGIPFDVTNAYWLPLLARKTIEWSYEKEWRFIALLKNASKQLNNVYLFRIPFTAIRNITFGAKARAHDIKYISEIIYTNPELSHIELYQSHLSKRESRIEFQKM